jgi:hypothetical protein
MHLRLKQLAASRNTSVNRLLDELATIALVQHSLSVQTCAAATAGNPARGLVLLNKLDADFGNWTNGVLLNICLAGAGHISVTQACCGMPGCSPQKQSSRFSAPEVDVRRAAYSLKLRSQVAIV